MSLNQRPLPVAGANSAPGFAAALDPAAAWLGGFDRAPAAGPRGFIAASGFIAAVALPLHGAVLLLGSGSEGSGLRDAALSAEPWPPPGPSSPAREYMRRALCRGEGRSTRQHRASKK